MLWKKYIKHISVSQIKTHDTNPRRWALEKLEKLPTTASHYTEIGKEIHDALEHLLLDKTYPEHVSKCVNAYSEYLDGTDIKPIETELQFLYQLAPDLPPILGFIDVLAETKDGIPVIIDHKTSASGSTFLKQDDLKTDTQLLVYAAYVLSKVPQDRVIVQHNQYKYRNKHKILKVISEEIKASDVADFMRDLETRVREGIIKSIEQYDAGGFMSVPYRNDPKNRWPCEYEGICKGIVSPDTYRRVYECMPKPVMRDQLMDMLEKEIVGGFDPIDLTYNLKNDKIELKKEEVKKKMLKLSEVMSAARKKYEGVSNTWDRREAMTKAVIEFVKKQKDLDIVLLPGHFIGGSLDPEYSPVVTQLKELNIKVAVEL